MNYTTSPATLGWAKWFMPRLRWEDVREIQAASGSVPVALERGIRLSSEALVLWPQGHVNGAFALYGVVPSPLLEGAGIVWLVATPEVTKHRKAMMREAAFRLEQWSRKYPRGLHCVVDSRNDLHLRWLELLGFTFGSVVSHNGTSLLHAIYTDKRPSHV